MECSRHVSRHLLFVDFWFFFNCLPNISIMSELFGRLWLIPSPLILDREWLTRFTLSRAWRWCSFADVLLIYLWWYNNVNPEWLFEAFSMYRSILHLQSVNNYYRREQWRLVIDFWDVKLDFNGTSLYYQKTRFFARWNERAGYIVNFYWILQYA